MENIKLALIGYPLGHSYSPMLYDCAFKEFNIKGSYELLPTASEDLISKIKYLRVNKYFGFNVTIPHKVPLTLFLSKYDEFVNMTGAVNTVKIEEDLSLSGYNTDVMGFVEAIPKDVQLENKKAAIIGTGGAARAICAGLAICGVTEIDLYTRNVINSKEIIETLRKRFDKIKINSIQTSLMNGLEDIDILVNTTPVGMKNYDEENSPVDDKNIESLKDGALVYDIVYNPYKTALISKALKYNKKVVCGLDMLIHQACCAFEVWTTNKPNFEIMKNKILEDIILTK